MIFVKFFQRMSRPEFLRKVQSRSTNWLVCERQRGLNGWTINSQPWIRVDPQATGKRIFFPKRSPGRYLLDGETRNPTFASSECTILGASLPPPDWYFKSLRSAPGLTPKCNDHCLCNIGPRDMCFSYEPLFVEGLWVKCPERNEIRTQVIPRWPTDFRSSSGKSLERPRKVNV
jgi:hypothetical protein